MIHNLNVARQLVTDALYETQDGEFVFARRQIKRGKTQCEHVGNGARAGTFWPSELRIPLAQELLR